MKHLQSVCVCAMSRPFFILFASSRDLNLNERANHHFLDKDLFFPSSSSFLPRKFEGDNFPARKTNAVAYSTTKHLKGAADVFVTGEKKRVERSTG